ncbi:hypothetical protein ABMA27_010627 [Loxostege sticticalis]|uniref:MULE transposase domain-containing protein n=1 Tax=Loxostege sticticalis TaxID=481309 RepID=A0ABR3H3S4_LOXSC
MDSVVIEKSKRGKDIILMDGYEYMLNRHVQNKYYWCCVYKNKKQCRSTLMTECSENSGHSIKSTATEHTHAPSAATQDSIIFKNKFKRDAAASSSEGPVKLIQKNLEAVPSTSACSLPNKNALRQIVYRARKQSYPKEPTSLEEIDVPEDYTIEGEKFLAKDIKYGENKRMLLFCTKQNIRLLRDSPVWIMDGTFKTTPGLFVQIYSIYGIVGYDTEYKKIVPLVYCFLVDKTEETYMVVFRELLAYAEELEYNLSPQHIITDFETAVINVVKIYFPEANHSGCLFHLAQNLWRKIQNSGLSSRYGNDSDFSLKLRHIVALAYLKPEEISEAFEELKNNVLPEEAHCITEWFEVYYVLGKVKSHSKGTTLSISRVQPMFPPHLWSMYRINELGLPRTQNNVEAWHRRNLMKEQITTNHTVEKALAGIDKTPPRKRGRRLSNAISRICENRDNMELIPFLRALANHIEL